MPSPLIDQLINLHRYPRLSADNLDDFMDRDVTLALFLTEDPNRYPESNDVAVILPELMSAFPDRFEAVVVDRALESLFKERYDVAVWPCLVFVRHGRYLGKINKVRDWSDYMALIPEILDRQPRHNPGVGIPLVNETMERPNA